MSRRGKPDSVPPVITFTTDFGAEDWFAGVLSGIVLGICPTARIVTLSHGIPAGNIPAGAFALLSAYSSFPRGTIHVGIVDPGVGSARTPILIRSTNYVFVGPDNGLLMPAAEQDGIREVRAISNTGMYARAVPSRTFHGRDIFAPVAARLASGLRAVNLGPVLQQPMRFEFPKATGSAGEVIYIDRFGNCITNLPAVLASQNRSCRVEVTPKKVLNVPLRDHYQAVSPGKLVCVPGSTGFLEVAANGDSAATKFRIKVGTKVRACS